MGSSEVGYFPLLRNSPEDWIYFHFDPRMKGIEFREISPGLYEQFFQRHSSTDPFHWTFFTFPDRSEFSMNDVFSKHPSKPNLWLYEGRSDDVIVFSNGEKVNPNDMEAILRTHPGISGALIVGQGRFEAAALLELKDGISDRKDAEKSFLDSLSPYVTKANKQAPAYAKLAMDHILFTKSEKPMLRTDKGTVKRRATNQAYEKEIDELYANVADMRDSLQAVQLNPGDQDALKVGIHRLLTEMEGFSSMTYDQDFFAAGMDSLQVMNLVRQLQSSFREYDGGGLARIISARTVYSNPNVFRLAIAVQGLANHGEATPEGLEQERVRKMEEMLDKYSEGLPEPRTYVTQRQGQGLTVVLTGSTGSLGSYLLDSLFTNTHVTKIICLNRGADGETKQKYSNRSRGLITEWGDKVRFLTTDLSKSDLGLYADDYQMLINEASAIIREQLSPHQPQSTS